MGGAELIGDPQRRVDPPVERTVDVREVPVDAADLEAAGFGGVPRPHGIDHVVISPTGSGQQFGFPAGGGLAERGEVPSEHGPHRLDRGDLVAAGELGSAGAVGQLG